MPVTFAPPGDLIVLEAADERLFALADRLWKRVSPAPHADRSISIRVAVRHGSGPGPDAEQHIVWSHADEAYTVSLQGFAHVSIGFRDASIDADTTAGFLGESPALAARTLLEAPVAVLLSRRGFTVLHAAAVVGPRGAAVIRGAEGAGKSTLTAAAWKAGFEVLADESLLVSRADHDDLAACVRDLTILPDAARLLSIDEAEVAFSGGEEKRRIDLFGSSTPGRRAARRAATLLLGEREPGPARLTPLSRAGFLDAFRLGSIPQERFGDPDAIAESWAGASSFRLDGTADLAGAVGILRTILG